MSPSASDLLHHGAAQAAFSGWTLVEVTGRDRERYLHSQLSSDVRSLAVGAGQLSALLDSSGRLQSFFFLHKLAGAIRLLVPSEAAQHTADFLAERVIADEVEIVTLAVAPMRLVLGPAAAELASRLPADLTFACAITARRRFAPGRRATSASCSPSGTGTCRSCATLTAAGG